MSRRKFVEGAAKGAAAAAILSRLPLRISEEAQTSKPSGLATRPLGKTGFKTTILGLGGAVYPRVERKSALAAVEKGLELGITYYDTARQYGNGKSEEILGTVLAHADQEKLWIATKTLFRSYAKSRDEIAGSLKRLKLKKPLDCIQLHAINDMKTLDTVMSKGGSFQAALEAQKAGLVRFIGFTNHARPEVALEALRRYPFATALVACGVADSYIGDFAARFLPTARKQGVGAIAMKVFGEGRLIGKLDLRKMLHWVLSQPIDVALTGVGSPKEVEENVAHALAFKPMTAQEQALLEAAAKPFGTEDLLWWKRGVK
ncbi:MAG: hypothetical protein B1H03_06950 [Planctomycetales bacterium 4484_113]|nr:MAG: hypothetical protein B1H03_06950 [Planctomycetales bacterium 4484_113]